MTPTALQTAPIKISIVHRKKTATLWADITSYLIHALNIVLDPDAWPFPKKCSFRGKKSNFNAKRHEFCCVFQVFMYDAQFYLTESI